MPEKIARVQATIYVTTHLSIAPLSKIQQDFNTVQGQAATENLKKPTKAQG